MLNLESIINLHSIGHDLQDVKISFGHDMKIGVGGLNIEGKQGELLNLPRWVGTVLSDEKLAEIQDTDMIVELKQSIVKENVQGEFDLATLDKHFYIKLRKSMKNLERTDYDKVESMLNSLVRKRQGKIIRLADSLKITADIAQKLTIEELVFYNTIYESSQDFKKKVLGETK